MSARHATLRDAIGLLKSRPLGPVEAATVAVLEAALMAHETHDIPAGDMTTRTERLAVDLAAAVIAAELGA